MQKMVDSVQWYLGFGTVVLRLREAEGDRVRVGGIDRSSS